MISGKYYSDEINVIDKLYAPCLSWSSRYVRNAGYFSSHVYQTMSRELLDFILRDTQNEIKLITCIDVYPSDFDAMVSDRDLPLAIVYQELREMLNDEVISDPVKMLAALIATGQMTVYVSLRKPGQDSPYSLDHSKSGYFSNGERIIAFDGSINETYPALVRGLDRGNREHFNIYAKDEIDDKTWENFALPLIKRLDSDCEGPFPNMSGDGTIIIEIKDLDKIDRDRVPGEISNIQSERCLSIQ